MCLENFAHRRETVLRTSGLASFWDFQGDDFTAISPDGTRLETVGEGPGCEADGFFGPRCMRFEADGMRSRGFLRARPGNAPWLWAGGAHAQVSVVAWLKRSPGSYSGCQFLAGVWNEHGRRQCGMFLNLGIWESAQQVGAHVSSHGGATPGFPYCMDAAIGATAVDFDRWHCAAISFDGEEARVFLDGILDVREPRGEPGRNPFRYPGGLQISDADFTIGAVERPESVIINSDGTFTETGSLLANPFVGSLGGLAIFRRALTAPEMRALGTVHLSSV